MCAPFENHVGVVSLRVQQQNVTLETKTKDNVFVTVAISIQYQAMKDKVSINNPTTNLYRYFLFVIIFKS